MTPEAQRIAIAEACGWKNCRCDEGTVNMPPKGEPDDDFNRDVIEHRKCKPYCGYPIDPHREVLPDYLNDLNAMHEAEKVLGEFGTLIWRQYQNHIARGDVAVLCGVICHATAAERAESFLRTLGLWK